MKTRTEALEEIRRKADRDIVETNLRYDIYDMVLTVLTPDIERYSTPVIHIHSLWGTIGSVRWEAGSGDTGNAPDAALLGALLRLYTPEPLVHVRCNTASFRPAREDWKSDGEITAAHPVIINVESLRVAGRTLREVRVMFQWNAYIADKLMRFCVVFDGSRVNVNDLLKARSIRWQNGTTETLWWELGETVPDFPALIKTEDLGAAVLRDVLAGL